MNVENDNKKAIADGPLMRNFWQSFVLSVRYPVIIHFIPNFFAFLQASLGLKDFSLFIYFFKKKFLIQWFFFLENG